jgi:hypothetical protein
MRHDPPDFRELIGDDLPAEERARLERVHELLVEAGPPPELPPALAEPTTEAPSSAPIMLPRRRTGAVFALAAALALVALLGGYLAGRSGSEKFDTFKSVPMHGVGATASASATIDIGAPEKSGNWPLRVVVRNLPSLPKGSYYEMFLTQQGKPIAACGIFGVNGRKSTVRMTLPRGVGKYDGWIVTRERPQSGGHDLVLTT